MESPDRGAQAVLRAREPVANLVAQARVQALEEIAAAAQTREGARRGQPAAGEPLAVPRALDARAHSPAEPQRQLVHAPLEVAERAGRGALEALGQLGERIDHRLLLADDELGGRRGRWRAQVGDEVGDREIHLVADGRHHGRLGAGDGARDDLFVEGPEIFERSAAAADDDDVDVAERVEVAQPLRDLLGGAVALHAGGRDHDVQLAEAAADHAQHVADRRAAQRRHHADLSREARQLALARLIEQPLGLEPGLELVEGQLQGAEPLGLEQLDDHLVLAALRVDLDAAEGHHVQPVARLELDPARAVAEQHDAQLGVGVLQREVGVPRAVDAVVRDLTLDPHGGEAIFERLANPRGQLGDRQHRAVGAQTGTRSRRMDEARPVSGSSAITTPWRDAGPRAVSKRIGIWLRKRWMIWSRSTPMTASVGAVRPRSAMYAVPPGSTRSQSV